MHALHRRHSVRRARSGDARGRQRRRPPALPRTRRDVPRGAFAADQQRSEPTATLAAKRRTVIGELDRLRAAGAIDDATYAERRAAYEDAKRTVKKLSGARKVELGAVVSTLEDVAARGQLTASRLAPLFLTLAAQPRVVDHGPAAGPGPARRLRRLPDRLAVLPRAGIQIQVLGTFGKVNALWSSRQTTALGQAVDELLRSPPSAPAASPGSTTSPTARARRRGSRASPRARRCRRSRARRRGSSARTRCSRSRAAAWGSSSAPAPEGVRVPAGAGTHYAQYSFEPGLRILNGFIQSLVGLYDYGRLAADDAREGAVRDRRGARPRGGADLRHRRVVAVLARDRHARVRPRLPHAAARLPRPRSATARRSRPTAAPRTTSRPT